jgi:hypothetical protein
MLAILCQLVQLALLYQYINAPNHRAPIDFSARCLEANTINIKRLSLQRIAYLLGHCLRIHSAGVSRNRILLLSRWRPNYE